MIPNMLELAPKLGFPKHFQIFRKVLENFSGKLNFEILNSKSISVTKTEWKWYPICWNWPKTANSRDFPNFQKISGRISGKLKFWISEHKIKLSDKNWEGKIPNTLKLVKISQFQATSRFPNFQIPDFRKTGILKFWAQNQFQWPTLSGIDTQYVGIGPKQQIPGNFQISRFPDSRFQENWNFEFLSTKSSSVTKTEREKYPIH